MPGPEQTARIQAAHDATTALVHLWAVEVDAERKRAIAIIADGITFADLQAQQYTASRRALSPIAFEAPENPLDGGATNPHWVRGEVATHIAVQALSAGERDLRQWSALVRALDTLWPATSLQARAILRDYLPSAKSQPSQMADLDTHADGAV